MLMHHRLERGVVCLREFPLLLALFTTSFPLLRYAFARVPHWNTFSLSRSSLLLTDMTLVDDFDTPAIDFLTHKFIFFTHFFQMFTRLSWDFSFSPSITPALDLRPSEDLPTGVSTQVKSSSQWEFFKTFKRIRKVCRCEWTQNLSKPRRSLFDADAVACIECSSIGSCTVFFSVCRHNERDFEWVNAKGEWKISRNSLQSEEPSLDTSRVIPMNHLISWCCVSALNSWYKIVRKITGQN